MSAKKGFSKKELADQHAKVAELVKEEGKVLAAIERAERTLLENREKLKQVQRSRAAENAKLDQVIQKGIRAAAKGDADQRAALIQALLLGADGEDGDPEPQPKEQPGATGANVADDQGKGTSGRQVAPPAAPGAGGAALPPSTSTEAAGLEASQSPDGAPMGNDDQNKAA
ncbi:hypothetical protein [Sphingomonas sp. 3-13AW]|uniref:hypothetical protein n=1 Tax=Sphingomonas sp. 3-13AW TaxID=3050450 RepID=UPI003BB7B8FF